MMRLSRKPLPLKKPHLSSPKGREMEKIEAKISAKDGVYKIEKFFDY